MNIREFIITKLGDVEENMVQDLIFKKTFQIYNELIEHYLCMVDYKTTNKFLNARQWLSVDQSNRTYNITESLLSWSENSYEACEKICNYMYTPTKVKTNDGGYIVYNNAIDYLKVNKRLLLRKIAEIESLYTEVNNDSNDSIDSTGSNKKFLMSVNTDHEMLEMLTAISDSKTFNEDILKGSNKNEDGIPVITYGYPAKNPLKNGVSLGMYTHLNEVVQSKKEFTLVANELKDSLQSLSSDTSRLLLLVEHTRIQLAGSDKKDSFKKNKLTTIRLNMDYIAEFFGYPSANKKARQRILTAISQLNQLYVTVPIKKQDPLREFLDISEKTTEISAPLLKVEMWETANVKRDDVSVNDKELLSNRLLYSTDSFATENKIITAVHLTLGMPFEALLHRKYKYISHIVPESLLKLPKRYDMGKIVGLYLASIFRVNFEQKKFKFSLSFFKIAQQVGVGQKIVEANSKYRQQMINRFCDSIALALRHYVDVNEISKSTLDEFESYRKTITSKNWDNTAMNFTIELI